MQRYNHCITVFCYSLVLAETVRTGSHCGSIYMIACASYKSATGAIICVTLWPCNIKHMLSMELHAQLMLSLYAVESCSF